MLKSRLPEIATGLQAKVDAALAVGANRVAAEARDRVPVNSGALRDAIRVEHDGPGEYTVLAGDNDAFYGHLVEFGTSLTPARPFLIPAVESRRGDVLDDVKRALKGL